MNYSLRQIRMSLSMEKKAADGIWSTFVLRPLSIPVTWIALRLGLSANAVSWISAVIALAGGIMFGMTGFWVSLTGILLLNLFSILDCVDGNVARVRETAGPWGGWSDAVVGFIAYSAIFLASGVYVFLRGGWWPVLLVTGITSSANLLTRVAYQKYKTIEPGTAEGSVSAEQMLAENFGITGFLMPALILCHFFGGMIWVVWFNALFYCGGACITLFKLARKAGAAR
jgi:phosphatidylglycerophosphate synthase